MTSCDGPFGPGFPHFLGANNSRYFHPLRLPGSLGTAGVLPAPPNESSMKTQKRGRTDDDSNFRDPLCVEEECSKTEENSINGTEMRCATSGAVQDEELLLQNEVLRDETPNPARSNQFGDRDQKGHHEGEHDSHQCPVSRLSRVQSTDGQPALKR